MKRQHKGSEVWKGHRTEVYVFKQFILWFSCLGFSDLDTTQTWKDRKLIHQYQPSALEVLDLALLVLTRTL